MLKNKEKVLKYLLFFYILLIFSWSLKPAPVSSAESGAALAFVQAIFQFFGASGAFLTDHIIRKTAHFTEYFGLGLLLCAYWKTSGRRKWFLLGAAVPVIDECIQLFSPGRACRAADMLLDVSGILTGVLTGVLGSVLLCFFTAALSGRLQLRRLVPAGAAALLAFFAVFLTAVWDNAALLRLPAGERGISSVQETSVQDGSFTAEMGGRYADKLMFRLSGEIRLKPSEDAEWVSFPAGTRSLRLKQEITYAADKAGNPGKTLVVYDNNPAWLTEQVLAVKGKAERVTVSAVLPETYSDSAGPDGGSGEKGTEALPEADGADVYSEADDTDVYPQYDFSGLSMDAFQIVNQVRINPYLAFCTFAFTLCLLLLFFYRRAFFQKPELAFLLICLTFGTAMCISLPRNKVGYDEETHLQAAMDVAAFPGELHISDAIVNDLIVTDYNDPGYQPGGEEEMQLFDARLSAEGNYKDGANSPDFYTLPNRIPAYLAMAAGLKLGKLFSLSWADLILLGRLGNLLLYAALMYAAIRLAPIGKLLLFVIALFPENVFLASTYSYDPFVTGCLMLGFAALLRELLRNPAEPVSRKNIVLMLAAFALGCLPKAVYAPLVLTALLIPGRRFRTRAEKWEYRAAVVLVFCLLLATFILPTVVSPAETGDVRGGATSEVSQVGFILGNPVGYALILLSQMIRWVPQCFIGPDCTTFMGHLVNGYTVWKGPWVLVVILLLLSVFAERMNRLRQRRGDQRRNEQQERRKVPVLWGIWNFLMIGAASVLIWTSMYVAFTEPGAREISGVQGRYFIPLMFPLYLLLIPRRKASPAGTETASAAAPGTAPDAASNAASAEGQRPGIRVKLARHFDLWYYFIQTAAALILAAAVWISVLSPFCL